MSITPQAIRKLLDEVEASRASRKRAWENLQEIRWVLKEATGIDLPSPARKTIDLEGRVVKERVRKIVNDSKELCKTSFMPSTSSGSSLINL